MTCTPLRGLRGFLHSAPGDRGCRCSARRARRLPHTCSRSPWPRHVRVRERDPESVCTACMYTHTVHVCARGRVCSSVQACVCIHTCMYARAHVSMHTRVRVRMYCVHICAHMSVCACTACHACLSLGKGQRPGLSLSSLVATHASLSCWDLLRMKWKDDT